MSDSPTLPVDYVQALDEAFERIGGVESLALWAMANPTEFYKLIAKRLPNEVVGDGGGPLIVQFKSI